MLSHYNTFLIFYHYWCISFKSYSTCHDERDKVAKVAEQPTITINTIPCNKYKPIILDKYKIIWHFGNEILRMFRSTAAISFRKYWSHVWDYLTVNLPFSLILKGLQWWVAMQSEFLLPPNTIKEDIHTVGIGRILTSFIVHKIIQNSPARGSGFVFRT